MSNQILWEGIMWTQTSSWASKERTMRCDGCENDVNAVGRFSAVDPAGATIEAKWCFDCQEHARAYAEQADKRLDDEILKTLEDLGNH